MNSQPDLFDDATPTTLAFREFDRNNPRVFSLLKTFSRAARKTGRKRMGIRMIWERMRWEIMITTTDSERDYKLNNNYTSRYARKLMAECNDLDGMFEIRELRS